MKVLFQKHQKFTFVFLIYFVISFANGKPLRANQLVTGKINSLCQELEQSMDQCLQQSNSKSCRKFNTTFKKLMKPLSKFSKANQNQPGSAKVALWSCGKLHPIFGTPVYHSALRLLSQLKVSRSLFASDRFRKILIPPYTQMYFQHSLEVKSPVALAEPSSSGRTRAPAQMTQFNQKCPEALLCPQLARSILQCEESEYAPDQCEEFIRLFGQSMQEFDCQPPADQIEDSKKLVAVLWKCESPFGGQETPVYYHALELLSQLALPAAQNLFASADFRKMLEGQYIEQFHALSLKTAYQLAQSRRRVNIGISLGFGFGGGYLGW